MEKSFNKLIISFLVGGTIVCAVAIVCGIFSAPYFRNRYILEHGCQTQALVTDAEYTSIRTGKLSYYKLTYEFTIEGILHTGETTDQYTDGKEYVGKNIPITYLPNGQSCSSDYDSYEFGAFIMAIFFGAVAVFIFSITIWIVVKSRREMKETGF